MEQPVGAHHGQLPSPHGLYDPQFEHDACGVGFVAHIKGRKSHSIIEQALGVLANLAHRGACGCDPETSDGAGILFQIPHRYFADQLAARGLILPEVGHYGVGMLFMPPNAEERAEYEALIEQVIAEEGQHLIAWRDVPVDSSTIAPLSSFFWPTPHA